MSQGISTGLIPPRPGLEREEPELEFEDDIPTDDRHSTPCEDSPAGSAEQEERGVERE